MTDNDRNVTPIGAARLGTTPKKTGGQRSKLLHRKALEDESARLQDELMQLREAHENLQQRYASLGAVAHAFVLRHGRQVFSLAELDEKCTLAGLRWGREGEDRVVVELSAQLVPPEGKVT